MYLNLLPLPPICVMDQKVFSAGSIKDILEIITIILVCLQLGYSFFKTYIIIEVDICQSYEC